MAHSNRLYFHPELQQITIYFHSPSVVPIDALSALVYAISLSSLDEVIVDSFFCEFESLSTPKFLAPGENLGLQYIGLSQNLIGGVGRNDFSISLRRKTKNRTRVISVMHENSYSGAPIYLNRLLKNLDKNEYEVINLVLKRVSDGMYLSNTDFVNVFLDELIPKVTSEDTLTSDWRLTAIADIAVTNFVKRIDPDLIFANSIATHELIRIASEFQIPSILYIHEHFGINQKALENGDSGQKILLNTLKAACIVLFGSKSASRKWAECTRDFKFKVIPSYLNLEEISNDEILSLREQFRDNYNIKYTDVVFLCVANFEERKQILELVQAFETAAIDNSKIGRAHV